MATIQTTDRPYRGLSRDTRKSRRRECLLDAALALFGTRGYERTTVRQICARARLTERYFYESFANREDLLLVLFHDLAGRMASRIVQAVGGAPPDALDQAKAAVDACVGYLAEDPRRLRILFREGMGSSRELEQQRRRMIHEFARLVRRTAREFDGPGPETSTDAYLTSLGVVPAMVQLITEWLEGGLDVSRERLVDHCAELMVTIASVSSNRPGQRPSSSKRTRRRE